MIVAANRGVLGFAELLPPPPRLNAVGTSDSHQTTSRGLAAFTRSKSEPDRIGLELRRHLDLEQVFSVHVRRPGHTTIELLACGHGRELGDVLELHEPHSMQRTSLRQIVAGEANNL